MKYMLLCCINQKDWNALPESQRDQIMTDYHKLIDETHEQGIHIMSAKLEDATKAVTVRENHGKHVTTDGPFAETKEQLGGFHMVECANIDEAVALAKRIPTLPAGGTVEVREVAY